MEGAMPDEAGLAMVFGHRDAHFRKLGHLAVGDKLDVDTMRGGQHYRVARIEIVDRDLLQERLRFGARTGHGLVLVTCFPFRYIGPAPQRYLVWLENETSPRTNLPGGRAKLSKP